MHVPPEWAEAVQRVQGDGIRTVVVIGATDVGKSTLCRFLLDQARRAGRGAALLDTDAGQKTVGPPACVTLAGPHGIKLFFVGTTDPVRGWRRLIEGTRHLADEADADLVIVNTSGLLAGPGRKLKAAKIETLRPDLLVALGNGPDLEAILSDHPEVPILRLPRSPEARRKTDGERRAARREAFRHYFTGSPVLHLGRGAFQPTGPDRLLPPGLLVGLTDGRGRDLGLGLLRGCPDDTVVEVLTPVPEGSIAHIVPGLLRLDENFSESPARTPG